MLAALAGSAFVRVRGSDTADGLEPLGRIHVPIGIPDALDTLKTFVEGEGNFSPGAGTYGVYWWLDAGGLIAPTQARVHSIRGLRGSGLLIPWTEWRAGDIVVTTEVCHVEQRSPAGMIQVVASRARVRNSGTTPRTLTLICGIRALGAAGGDIRTLTADENALLVNGRTAVVVDRPAEALDGELRIQLTLAPGATEQAGIVCPVLPGRSAARHHWIDIGQNALADAAELDPAEGGIPQPDAGLDYYRSLRPAGLFRKAESYWTDLLRPVDVRMPDPRWGESLRAILGHTLMCLNEGAPDVAVLNYNVFNRDGMYIANIMQKAGLARWSERIIDYFLAHPFNGRAYPEADNPGQILCAIHQHWLLTHDQQWLKRVCSDADKIARMVEYYRTSAGPHYVAMDSLDFGDAVPAAKRVELKPGRCDGVHPEYTEAFDIAGLRGAAQLAGAMGQRQTRWRELAQQLFDSYHARFGATLPARYGSYSVLWPCRLYAPNARAAFLQFAQFGAQQPRSWRYFPLATAHQGLFAGNREAGYRTIESHLDLETMRGLVPARRGRRQRVRNVAPDAHELAAQQGEAGREPGGGDAPWMGGGGVLAAHA